MKGDFVLLLLMISKCTTFEVQPQYAHYNIPLTTLRYYHTGMECSGSLTCILPKCELTPNEYGPAKISTGCTLLRPLTKVFVQQITERRIGLGEYRPIISYPPFEWCEVMMSSYFNPIYKMAVSVVSNSVPELLHLCPYWGPVYANNITLNMEKVFMLFAPGEYSNTMTIFDDADQKIFTIRILSVVV